MPLVTALKSGQRVELTVAKTGGPSRDWMSAERGFARSPRARQKIRQWFNAQALTETVAEGRAIVEREVKREGRGSVSLEALAAKLGLGKADDLFAAVARDEVNLRQLHEAMRALAGLRAPVDAFFDKVTVNCESADLRANRLRLLSRIRAGLGGVADFSRIEG